MNIFTIYLLYILSQIISLYVPKKVTIKFQKTIPTVITQQPLRIWTSYFAPFFQRTLFTVQ